MASGHALVSSMPSPTFSQGQELKLDIVQLDSQGVVLTAIQSSSNWGIDNSTLIGSSAPRLDTTTEINIVNMMKTKADISLLLSPNQGHLNHMIDIYTGPSNTVEQLYSEGFLDWLFSKTQTSSHISLQQNVRYPTSNVDWNGLSNIEYNDSSISFTFSNRDQFGTELASGRLLSLYDVQSAPSSWYVKV